MNHEHYGAGINLYAHFVDGVSADGRLCGGSISIDYYPKVHKAVETVSAARKSETVYDVPKDIYDIKTVKLYLESIGVFFPGH